MKCYRLQHRFWDFKKKLIPFFCVRGRWALQNRETLYHTNENINCNLIDIVFTSYLQMFNQRLKLDLANLFLYHCMCKHMIKEMFFGYVSFTV